MSENYFVDTTKFSIDKFRNILKTKDILPGRIVLKDNIDERFDMLKSKAIYSLKNLLETLKTKPKIDRFSKDSGLTVDYLMILRREANSYISVPVRFAAHFARRRLNWKLMSAESGNYTYAKLLAVILPQHNCSTFK